MLRWNLAGLVLLAGATLVQADDVIRLGGSFAADDDTHLVHRRGFSGGYFGPRFSFGYSSRFYGGYGWGGYHRPFYSSFYHRPYFSSFYHRPYYSYGYWPRFDSSFYYQPFAYSPYRSYYYSSPAYYFIDPCVGEQPTMPEATSLGSSAFAPRQERAGPAMPPVDQGDGTYRYDGGPRQTVPMPDTGPASKPASPALPRGFKLATQPATPKHTYAAYGESRTTTTTPATTRFVSETPLPPVRLTYAAYDAR